MSQAQELRRPAIQPAISELSVQFERLQKTVEDQAFRRDSIWFDEALSQVVKDLPSSTKFDQPPPLKLNRRYRSLRRNRARRERARRQQLKDIPPNGPPQPIRQLLRRIRTY
jgi:hypothetical protein